MKKLKLLNMIAISLVSTFLAGWLLARIQDRKDTSTLPRHFEPRSDGRTSLHNFGRLVFEPNGRMIYPGKNRRGDENKVNKLDLYFS